MNVDVLCFFLSPALKYDSNSMHENDIEHTAVTGRFLTGSCLATSTTLCSPNGMLIVEDLVCAWLYIKSDFKRAVKTRIIFSCCILYFN